MNVDELRNRSSEIDRQIAALEQERNQIAYALNNTQQANDPADIQTCPSRMNEMGPWKHEVNLDRWKKVGEDRCCSFCGSIHPEDVESLLGSGGAIVEGTTKSYKVYIRRPDVANASQGGIKYYTWHAFDDKERTDKLIEEINNAARLSARKLFNGVA